MAMLGSRLPSTTTPAYIDCEEEMLFLQLLITNMSMLLSTFKYTHTPMDIIFGLVRPNA